MKKKKEIIIGVTGSIASYKACDIVAALRRDGHNVTPILTREAKEFITPLALQTMARNRVHTDMFELPGDWEPVHISLADKADLVLIAPATANIIGKLAHGICDDLLTCVVFATRAPVMIAPAMNERMYTHRLVQENIAILKKTGYSFIGPIKGRLACGREGAGHLAPVDEIVAEANRHLR